MDSHDKSSKTRWYFDTSVWIELFQSPRLLERLANKSVSCSTEIFFSDINHFELLGKTNGIKPEHLKSNKRALASILITEFTDPLFVLGASRLAHAKFASDEIANSYAALRSNSKSTRARRDVQHLIACQQINATFHTLDRDLSRLSLRARALKVELGKFSTLIRKLQ